MARSKKIQVNVTEETLNKIDELAKLFGLSRSGVVGYFIGQALLGYQTVDNVLKELGEAEMKKLLEKAEKGGMILND